MLRGDTLPLPGEPSLARKPPIQSLMTVSAARHPSLPPCENLTPQRLQHRMMPAAHGQAVREVETCAALRDRNEVMYVKDGGAPAAEEAAYRAAMPVTC